MPRVAAASSRADQTLPEVYPVGEILENDKPYVSVSYCKDGKFIAILHSLRLVYSLSVKR
jgi:hypothetical protein